MHHGNMICIRSTYPWVWDTLDARVDLGIIAKYIRHILVGGPGKRNAEGFMSAAKEAFRISMDWGMK